MPPIPIHIALERPRPGKAPNSPRLGSRFARPGEPSPLQDPSFDWSRHGLIPRWLDMESSDCAAALQPSIFHNRGGTELTRFLEGAQARSEVAILISTIGDSGDGDIRSPFGRDDASILLPEASGSIGGRRMPEGVRPTLAEELGAVERDLGLRLLQRAADAPWWSLGVHGLSLESPVGPPERREPGGRLEPILVDGLGDPVVAVWVSDAGDQRWYVVPGASSWDVLLDWLVKQALAEHAPGALRRAHSDLALDPALQSDGEANARRALEKLEDEHDQERRRLQSELAEATADVEPIRDGLLYGTADTLEDAVAAVLTAAGFEVVKLDEDLSDTASADQLVSHEGERRLVEIKSVSGRANEKLVAALYRHLDTWPQLKPHLPVDGGVLIVNHQHRLDPAERSAEVYGRAEFVTSLRVPVLSSRQLFDWWRASDWLAIREAILARPTPRQESSAVSPPKGSARTPQPPSWRERLTRRPSR